MKTNRILAFCLSICLAFSPFSAFAEESSLHTHEQAASETEAAANQPIITADGQSLPQLHPLGEPLFVSLADGSVPSYWQYDIDEIGYNEIFAADKDRDGTTSNDAGAAAARALKNWRFDADHALTMRIAALDRSKRVLHETHLQISMAEALILQQNCLPVPQSMTHGDKLVLAVSNSLPVSRWRYDLRTADGASIAVTTTASSDAGNALSGCLKSALHWGDTDLTGSLSMHIAGLDANGAQITSEAVISVSLRNAAIIADQGESIPASLTESKLIADTPALTLRTVSGGEAHWVVRAYDAKGNLIGEEVSDVASVSKAVSYFSISMVEDRFARHIDHIEITAKENGTVSDPVLIRIGTYCPACGEATKSENAHYIKACGHYRCDGHDHYQADCRIEGHCRAYYVKHNRACKSCGVRMCSEGGYNPANCYACGNCGESMCVSADLDHTVCEGCGKCLWQKSYGEHAACDSCGVYLCTSSGKAADHGFMRCGKHTACNSMGLKHYKGACGKDGHYTCDGEHDQCSGCKLYICDEGFAALNHERCDSCRMRKCDPRYIEAAHLTCAHCGGRLCEPGTEHTLHRCGVEGHYRCDGRWHNSEIISKYCEAEHQHRKCEGNPEHFCDPDDGGCGKFYVCSWSNVHTRCTMCGLRWCDRSNGGHQTPCGVRSHRPCQLPGFRYSDHAICKYCGNPRCKGTHAHCGELLPCPICKKLYVLDEHKRDCGHYDCASGEHNKCRTCKEYVCDGNEHELECPNCDGVYCTVPNKETGSSTTHSGKGCGK